MFKVGDILKLTTEPRKGSWYGESWEEALQRGDRVVVDSFKIDIPSNLYGFKGIRKGDPQWVDYMVEQEFELDIKTIRKKKLNKIYESVR